ncbi:hypothetical protein TYRP_002534 [Tyrophagus putrescentiae]|nr:hypothetical protein TYRP_002534 [Tyrophagus putrescentiae]
MVNEFACSYLPKSSKYFEEICLTDETFLERVGSLNIVIGVLALLLVAAIVLFLLFKFKKVLCCRQHKDNKVSSPGDIEMQPIAGEEGQAMLSPKETSV